MINRSWVEINLNTLASNFQIYKTKLSSFQEIMAVVKADAYGHGEKKVAEILQRIGCKHFAVSNIEEAIALRDTGISGQILILGYTPISSKPELLQYDITQPKSRQEMQEFCRIKTEKYFREGILKPMLELGLVKRTIPDKPKSPNQKYTTIK